MIYFAHGRDWILKGIALLCTREDPWGVSHLTCLCASNPWGLSKVLPGGTETSPRSSSIPGNQCLMPRSCIYSQLGWGWAGLLRARGYQEQPSLTAGANIWAVSAKVKDAHALWAALTGSDAMPPVLSCQLKLGRMEMQLLPLPSVHKEGTELTLLCTFTPELPFKCFLRWFLPLPQLNICIEPSKNLLLNLQDKIILKYLHCIQHWCRVPEKVILETFSFKHQYCKISPPPSITKD